MLIAENELKKNVDISQLNPKEAEAIRKFQLFCPGCKSEVIVKNGVIMSPHFAHKSRQICDLFSENESEEHLNGKKLIAENCEKYGIDYELEAYLPELQQRPDVLIEKTIAIEFQCSSLSIERFKERSKAYLKNGYQVVWLLGKNFHLKKKLSSLQKQFIYFSQKAGFYMWELDTEKNAVILDYFLLKLPTELIFRKQLFSLRKENLLEILAYPTKKKNKEKLLTSPTKNYEEQKFKWNQQLNMKQPKAMHLQAYFYTKGHNLRNLSELYFFPSFLTPLLMEEELILRHLVHAYFLKYEKGELEEILIFIKEERAFPVFILVGEENLLRYCLSLYLCCLRDKGIIQVENRQYYLVKQRESSKTFTYEILWLPLKYVMISK